MGRGGFVFGKRGICVDYTLNGTLEQHKDHHDAENLKTVARHVHHNGVHRNLLRRGHGDLPRLFHLQCVGLLGLLSGGLLLLTLNDIGVSDDRAGPGALEGNLTLPRLLEKPGGSGMLEAPFEARGMGEFNATTHCGGGGGGRRACDMLWRWRVV